MTLHVDKVTSPGATIPIAPFTKQYLHKNTERITKKRTMEQFLNEVEYQFEKHAAKKGKLMPSIRDRAEDLYLYQLNFA